MLARRHACMKVQKSSYQARVPCTTQADAEAGCVHTSAACSGSPLPSFPTLGDPKPLKTA